MEFIWKYRFVNINNIIIDVSFHFCLSNVFHFISLPCYFKWCFILFEVSIQKHILLMRKWFSHCHLGMWICHLHNHCLSLILYLESSFFNEKDYFSKIRRKWRRSRENTHRWRRWLEKRIRLKFSILHNINRVLRMAVTWQIYF